MRSMNRPLGWLVMTVHTKDSRYDSGTSRIYLVQSGVDRRAVVTLKERSHCGRRRPTFAVDGYSENAP